MSEKKLINLDQLVQDSIIVELGGVQFEVQKPSVVGILKIWKNFDTMTDVYEQIVVAIDFLYTLAPAAREAKAFDNLNAEQINVILTSLAGDIERETKVAQVGEKIEESSKKKLISESPLPNSSTGTPATS